MILGDYHTHTVYSHGKGSVEDNVKAAVSRGLKAVAITDHGFGHLLYNVRKSDFKYFLEDVEKCREKYPQIEVLAGVEANFISVDGDVDLPQKARERLDIAVCGYHNFAAGGIFSFFGFTLPRLMPWKNHKENIVKNTEAYIKAMDKHDIDFISHPMYGIKVDLKAVGEVARELGVFLELNGKRINMTDDEILMLKGMGCTFIVNSDAHSPSRVGEFSKPMAVVERLKLHDNIANWNKIPVFRSNGKRK